MGWNESLRSGEWAEQAKAVVFCGRYSRRSAVSMDLHAAPISPLCTAAPGVPGRLAGRAGIWRTGGPR